MRPPLAPRRGEPLSAGAFASISDIARSEAGLMLPPSKLNMVQSRLRPRLAALGLDTYDTYANFVAGPDGADERRLMISALTTNVSHFFRENHHFELLRDQVLPELATRARAGHSVRIWSAGCSSGQEPYSIAMTILDHAPELAAHDTLILATDIDPQILETARAGRYTRTQIQGVPEQAAARHLSEIEDHYVVGEPVRSLVRFRDLNLLAPWPMRAQFDVIFCRNVVIYFDSDTQNALWPRFETALRPGGWFFLGHSERVSDKHAGAFTTVGMTVYRSHADSAADRKTVEQEEPNGAA
jgi:chemotaxis protein methyltransferase CheR